MALKLVLNFSTLNMRVNFASKIPREEHFFPGLPRLPPPPKMGLDIGIDRQQAPEILRLNWMSGPGFIFLSQYGSITPYRKRILRCNHRKHGYSLKRTRRRRRLGCGCADYGVLMRFGPGFRLLWKHGVLISGYISSEYYRPGLPKSASEYVAQICGILDGRIWTVSLLPALKSSSKCFSATPFTVTAIEDMGKKSGGMCA